MAEEQHRIPSSQALEVRARKRLRPGGDGLEGDSLVQRGLFGEVPGKEVQCNRMVLCAVITDYVVFTGGKARRSMDDKLPPRFICEIRALRGVSTG